MAGRLQKRDRVVWDATAGRTDHAQLLKANGTTEIYLGLDNDKAGRTATERLRNEMLPPLVKPIHVVQWPEGMKDAADFLP